MKNIYHLEFLMDRFSLFQLQYCAVVGGMKEIKADVRRAMYSNQMREIYSLALF